MLPTFSKTKHQLQILNKQCVLREERIEDNPIYSYPVLLKTVATTIQYCICYGYKNVNYR